MNRLWRITLLLLLQLLAFFASIRQVQSHQDDDSYHRNLQSALEARWSVSLTPKPNQTAFDYAIGVGHEKSALIEFYVNNAFTLLQSGVDTVLPNMMDSCPSNNVDTTLLGSIVSPTLAVESLVGFALAEPPASSITPTDGTTGESGSIDLVLTPSIATSPAYFLQTPATANGQGLAVVQFCVRVGNQADDGTIVNFEELAMQARMTLDGTVLSSNAVLAAPENADTGTTDAIVGTTAYFCSADGSVLMDTNNETTVSQGDSVFICIEPEDTTLAGVEDINDMTVVSETNGTVIEQGVVNGTESDATSDKKCRLGRCIIEVLMTSKFFAASADDESMEVSATGQAVVTIGRRRVLSSMGKDRLLLGGSKREAYKTQNRIVLTNRKERGSMTAGTAASVGAMLGVVLTILTMLLMHVIQKHRRRQHTTTTKNQILPQAHSIQPTPMEQLGPP